MALEFKTATIRFQGVENSQTRTQTVPFTAAVKNAATAIQGFSFDFEGVVEHPIDKVQVNVGTASNPVGTTVVEAQATVNYSGKPSSDFEYNATVIVLVIAEL